MIIIRFIEMIANGIRSIFGGYDTPASDSIKKQTKEFLAMDLSKPLTRAEYQEIIKGDKQRIASDWKALGNDMRTAMDKLKKEHPLPSGRVGS